MSKKNVFSIKTDLSCEKQINSLSKELSKIIVETSNIKSLESKVFNIVSTIFSTDDVFVLELDENLINVNKSSFFHNQIGIANNDSFAVDIFSNDKHFYLFNNLDKEKKIFGNLNEVLSLNIEKNLALIKVNKNNSLWGYICIVNIPDWIKHKIETLDAFYYYINIAFEKIHLRDTLSTISDTDNLTGLQSRNKFAKDVERKNLSTKEIYGVIYIDVNGLKDINDEKGHSFGDYILIQVKQLIKSVYDHKYIYRIGGDEFVVFSPDNTEEEFLSKVSSLKNKFLLSNECSAAIGHYFCDDNKPLNEMVNHANEIMYEEKKKYYRFNPPTKRYRYAVDNVLGLVDTNFLEQEIENGKFIIHLQPKVTFKDEELIGAEALVRYVDKNNAIVGPNQFIPSLEKAKLTRYIDFFVFESICKKLKQWEIENRKLIPISVNFSRFTILEKRFVDKIIFIVTKYGVDKKLLEIEITEGVGDVKGRDMSHVLTKLKEADFSISIDDFGMKYANLSLFSSIEFDVLKIDRSLLRNISTSRKSRLLIKSLVQICISMDIKLIVEGVETKEQFDVLKTLDCYGAQGYLFSKPVPIDIFESDFLK